MAQKDTSEKILESYNDVFSDIVNVLLFNGKQVLSADELEDQAPRSYYKADGKIREIERDVAKRWKNGNPGKETIRRLLTGSASTTR